MRNDWTVPALIILVLFMGVFGGMSIYKQTHKAVPCVSEYPCCWDVPKGVRCIKCRDARI